MQCTTVKQKHAETEQECESNRTNELKLVWESCNSPFWFRFFFPSFLWFIFPRKGKMRSAYRLAFFSISMPFYELSLFFSYFIRMWVWLWYNALLRLFRLFKRLNRDNDKAAKKLPCILDIRSTNAFHCATKGNFKTESNQIKTSHRNQQT